MAATPDHRSGGKMVYLRQTRHRGTPYDRPNSSPAGPNWFSRFVSSPSRIIASGGKLLYSVFASDSSSSSSSSASVQDSDHEEDDDCENVHDGSGLGVGLPEKALSQKSDTKQIIVQLLLHESFSREEYEWLTNIIRSRVVNALPVGRVQAGRLDEMFSGRVETDINSSTLLDAAVMEARKWLEEKKGPIAKPDLQHGTGAVNSAVLTNGDEGDSTSPVDIAKSYMQARPPWASPSISHSELRSPTARQYSTAGGSLNLAKYKKASSASGTWNIHEEIRKVRSKATEDLLRNSGSSRVRFPLLSLDYKHGADCLTAAKSAAGEDKMVSYVKSLDATEREGSENMLGLQNDAIQNVSVPIPGQVEEATHCNDNTEGRSPSGPGQKLLLTEDDMNAAVSDVCVTTNNNLKNCIGGKQHPSSQEEIHDSGVCHVNSSLEAEAGEPVTSNGFPSFSSFSVKAAEEVNNMPLVLEKKQSEPEEACPSSETTTDMLNVSGNDTNALQDSSVGQHDLEHLDVENRKRKLGDKSVIEKQPGRKMSKYNRRGRGKGR